MPRVLNLRKIKQVPTGAIYVGRPMKNKPYLIDSGLGNPFKVKKGIKNIEVVKQYVLWTLKPNNTYLFTKIREMLVGQDLVCWCAPDHCHADYLLKVANAVSVDEVEDYLLNDLNILSNDYADLWSNFGIVD